MADIHEIVDLTGVNIRTLKKLDKMGYLKLTKTSDPFIATAKDNLRRGNPLTVEQIFHFIRNPMLSGELGKLEGMALKAIGEIGTLDNAMPWSVSQNVTLAKFGDKDGCLALANWLMRFIDASPDFAGGMERGHSWLSMRVLAHVPEEMVKDIVPFISKAFYFIRKIDAFKRYFRIDEKTKRTLYFRPKTLDL